MITILSVAAQLAAVVLLASQLRPTQVANIEQRLKPVSVVESSTGYEIYANVYFTGELANAEIIPGQTYAEAFAEGVAATWEGSYNGLPVSVHLTARDSSFGCVQVTISEVDESSDCCRAGISRRDKQIEMFNGDGRTPVDNNGFYTYSYDEFKKTAGHEFGHVLGLNDVYDDEVLSNRLVSPMNNSFEAESGKNVDYFVLFERETWENDGLYTYSNDLQVLQYILQTENEIVL